MTRRVVCAAVQSVTHPTRMLVGPRHFDSIMHGQMRCHDSEQDPVWKGAIQGFICQKGLFMDRTEAWVVAEKAGQIIRRVGGDGVELFSENLY